MQRIRILDLKARDKLRELFKTQPGRLQGLGSFFGCIKKTFIHVRTTRSVRRRVESISMLRSWSILHSCPIQSRKSLHVDVQCFRA